MRVRMTDICAPKYNATQILSKTKRYFMKCQKRAWAQSQVIMYSTKIVIKGWCIHSTKITQLMMMAVFIALIWKYYLQTVLSQLITLNNLQTIQRDAPPSRSPSGRRQNRSGYIHSSFQISSAYHSQTRCGLCIRLCSTFPKMYKRCIKYALHPTLKIELHNISYEAPKGSNPYNAFITRKWSQNLQDFF